MRACLPIVAWFVCAAAHADVYLLADGTRCEGVSVEKRRPAHHHHLRRQNSQGRQKRPARQHPRTQAQRVLQTSAAAQSHRCRRPRGTRRILSKEQPENAKPRNCSKPLCASTPANADAGKALGYALTEGKWRPAVDADVQIAVRPPPKMPEASRDQIAALQKRLEKNVRRQSAQPRA